MRTDTAESIRLGLWTFGLVLMAVVCEGVLRKIAQLKQRMIEKLLAFYEKMGCGCLDGRRDDCAVASSSATLHAFAAVQWEGNDGQVDLYYKIFTVTYYGNVVRAFRKTEPLKNSMERLTGPKLFLTHSLG